MDKGSLFVVSKRSINHHYNTEQFSFQLDIRHGWYEIDNTVELRMLVFYSTRCPWLKLDRVYCTQIELDTTSRTH